MKRIWSIVLAVCICLLTAGCADGGENSERGNGSGKRVVSSLKTLADGSGYLEVDGKPFPYLGVESRLDAYMNCEKKTVEEFEPYFEAAAKLGATVIAVPVDWRDLEIAKDDYDFRLMAKLLSFANEYKIKMEICWYSVNMCGDSNSYQIPEYIWSDEETYPKYDSSNKNAFWGYYGNQGYMKPSRALMEREALMIEKLMDYVYNWDLNNGERHPLIGIQVYNEPDGYPRWRVSQNSISENGKKITEEQAWQDVYTLLDNAGKAFKAAEYNVYTRVNLTTLTETAPFAKKIYALEGIDAVGNDPYVQSVGATYNTLTDLKKNLPGNFTHIAENKGVYTNTPSLLLTAAYCGAGYIIYDLSTPQYFIDNNSDPSTIDHGILNVDLTDKPHTESVRRTLKALAGTGEAVVLADKKDFAVFNIEESYPEENYTRSINTTCVTAEFSTSAGAVGFALVYDGYVWLFADAAAEIRLGNGAFSGGEYGSFRAGVWTADGEAERTENGGYLLDRGKLCRVKIDTVSGKLISNTKNYIGG